MVLRDNTFTHRTFCKYCKSPLIRDSDVLQSSHDSCTTEFEIFNTSVESIKNIEFLNWLNEYSHKIDFSDFTNDDLEEIFDLIIQNPIDSVDYRIPEEIVLLKNLQSI